MSIFRNTFKQEIQDQLDTRQKAINGAFGARSVKEIQYLNSRNSWIRMCSSVNVGNDQGALAKNNVLLGGTLKYESVNNNFVLRQGIDNAGSGSYSTKTITGTDPYRLGIRPMAGITSMDIKSKSAYGSLREATVNFVCWDIKQLEELELLYMRPGYTVLVEWGWLPYITLDKSGNQQLVTSVPNGFYDILNKGATDRTVIFKELYDKSLNSGGNYDAMFGYVRNYQWSARPDGGYDCQTTIISTGEIIESLKVNYVKDNLTILNSNVADGKGFLDAEFANQGTFPPNTWKEHYEKNILAGIWAEAYDKLGVPLPLSTTSVFKDNRNRSLSNVFYTSNNDPSNSITKDNKQVYITLEAMFDILNKYVIPKDSNNSPLISFSSYTEEYSSSPSELLCVAHPLQVSVDPSVCLINSPLWYGSGGVLAGVAGGASATNTKIDNIIKEIDAAIAKGKNNGGIVDLEKALNQISTSAEFAVLNSKKNIESILNDKSRLGNAFLGNSSTNFGPYTNIIAKLKSLNVLDLNVSPNPSVNTVRGTGGVVDYYLNKITLSAPTPAAATTSALISGAQQALSTLEFLKNLRPYFFDDVDGYKELGIIKEIYVNLDFLYKKSIDLNIESSDKKEKNEINLYQYVKNIISAIQSSLGNVSNFEIHVDPIDNKARVIDINYTELNKSPKLFELQVHNTKSVVRSYSLQSQIFPEQSTIIAIGSQAKGGQLGIQNNTMIDFNKSLIDRIIPDKGTPPDPASDTFTTAIASNLGGIVFLFTSLASPPAKPSPGTPTASSISSTAGVNVDVLSSKAKNNLRDLIVYFQSITASPGANRNIIPIKFSFTMDGIGGLVIGNLFKVNEDILPRGYKGTDAGVKLAQTVTGIGHTIGNGDWTTKIDALNIVLDSKTGVPFESLKLQELVEKSINSALTPSSAVSAATSPCSDVTNRTAYPILNYPLVPTSFSTIQPIDVINYIKSTSYSLAVKRATYASFGIESGWGKSVINNNAFGMQTDGGLWTQASVYIKGTTVYRENGTGRCRSFAVYDSWQKSIDHVLYIMNTRIEGSRNKEIVPKDPKDYFFFAKGYATNWVGNPISDPAKLSTLQSVYERAIREIT